VSDSTGIDRSVLRFTSSIRLQVSEIPPYRRSTSLSAIAMRGFYLKVSYYPQQPIRRNPINNCNTKHHPDESNDIHRPLPTLVHPDADLALYRATVFFMEYCLQLNTPVMFITNNMVMPSLLHLQLILHVAIIVQKRNNIQIKLRMPCATPITNYNIHFGLSLFNSLQGSRKSVLSRSFPALDYNFPH